MSEKRFAIIGQEYVSYYGGDAQIISNGTLKFRIWERQEDAQKRQGEYGQEVSNVEDDIQQNNLIRKTIQKQYKDWIIDSATSYDAALTLLQTSKSPYTIFLLDIQLSLSKGDRGGFFLAKEIRKQSIYCTKSLARRLAPVTINFPLFKNKNSSFCIFVVLLSYHTKRHTNTANCYDYDNIFFET